MATKRDVRSELRGALRQFVLEHPQGWDHEEWVRLLERLRAEGHAAETDEEIGRQLERERLAAMLGAIPSVGPQRIRVIIDRYDSLWGLRQSDAADLTRSTGIPRRVAERILGSL